MFSVSRFLSDGLSDVLGCQGFYLAEKDLKDDDLERLADSPNLLAVPSLLLQRNAITARGVLALARSPFLQNLRVLALHQNPIGEEGVWALVESPLAGSLVSLGVGEAGMGEGAIDALSHWKGRALQKLYLPEMKMGRRGAERLASVEAFSSLRMLWLRENGLEEKGVEAILASPFFLALKEVTLQDNPYLSVEDFSLLFWEQRHVSGKLTLAREGRFPDEVNRLLLKRSAVRLEPWKVWTEENEIAWKFLAYMFLSPALQEEQFWGFLEVCRLLVGKENPATFADARWNWSKRFLRIQRGKRLEAVVSAFPGVEVFEEAWKKESLRRASLEEALFAP